MRCVLIDVVTTATSATPNILKIELMILQLNISRFNCVLIYVVTTATSATPNILKIELTYD